MTSQAVIKVGFDGAGDLGRIAGQMPALKACSRATPLLDVQDLEAAKRARENGITKKQARNGISLSSLSEQYLGKPLNKSVQVCDWSRRPLSPAQRHYASMDAWAPL